VIPVTGGPHIALMMSTKPITDGKAPEPHPRTTPKRKQLADLLLEAGVISPEHLAAAEAERERTGSDLGRVLVDLGFARKEELRAVLAETIGWESVDEVMRVSETIERMTVERASP